MAIFFRSLFIVFLLTFPAAGFAQPGNGNGHGYGVGNGNGQGQGHGNAVPLEDDALVFAAVLFGVFHMLRRARTERNSD